MTEHGPLSATRITEIQRDIDAYRGYYVSTLLRELLQHATALEPAPLALSPAANRLIQDHLTMARRERSTNSTDWAAVYFLDVRMLYNRLIRPISYGQQSSSDRRKSTNG